MFIWKGKGQPVQLEKGDSQYLESGDKFSLVMFDYCFTVQFKKETQSESMYFKILIA